MDEDLRLKPFHVGKHRGHWYMINIEDMEARPIHGKTADLLRQVSDNGDSFWRSRNQEQLKSLSLLSQNRSKAARKGLKDPVPIVNAAFFLTQSCNLRCVYCYGEGGEYGHKGNMEERTAFQGVDWLIEQSGKVNKIHMGFFGGEPFLNFPLMQKTVDYARKKTREVDKKVDFHATTNGTLLDEKKIDFIRDQDINVMISFDGPRVIQDVQRPFAGGMGSYDVILPKIKNLLAVRPQTPGHAVLMEGTDPRSVKEALKEIGFTKVSITPASDCMLTCDKKKPISKRNLRNVQSTLAEEADMWLAGIKARDTLALRAMRNSSDLYHGLLAFTHNRKKIFPCGAGLGLAGISSSGDVYLCHRFVGMAAYKLGNIFDQHLDRDEYRKSPIRFVKKCRHCPARHYCAGGCKYDNAASTGSLFELPPEMCRLRCREFELSAYVSSRLDEADRAFLRKEKIVPPKPCPLDFG
ncbi:MAG: nif11-like peptide radical SAM maturase [Deltaproteobacteria bacterium]|nr:nif11-like peptide radical SAM maturase [Deltaproteobacteria bacterium]